MKKEQKESKQIKVVDWIVKWLLGRVVELDGVLGGLKVVYVIFVCSFDSDFKTPTPCHGLSQIHSLDPQCFSTFAGPWHIKICWI